MDEINEEQQIMKQKNNKKKLIGIIAVIIIIAILAIALIGSDTISISRGVTMRELQLDFNNEDHDYRHYNDGDTVVLVDRITSLEIKTGISGNPITILEFSAKPLPEVELNTQTSPYSWDIVESSTEDWYTYDPFSSTPVKTTFDGDIAVLEDISDTYHVGDMV
ncbi:MAG: hypothetical protein KKA35_16570, partial [Proteobacteria bacterium]|nr:hypothetical protein [Pseudomonadota bacterium]